MGTRGPGLRHQSASTGCPGGCGTEGGVRWLAAGSPRCRSAEGSERMLGSPVVRLWLPGGPDSRRDLGISGSRCVHGWWRVPGWAPWSRPPQEHSQPCRQAPAHLEQVSLALAVDAGEGCINGALDAPDVTDELGVAGPHARLIQLVEVLPWGERRGGSSRRGGSRRCRVTAQQRVPCAWERSPRYLGKHKGNRSSDR